MKNSACDFEDLEVQGEETASNNIPRASEVSRISQQDRASYNKTDQPNPGLLTFFALVYPRLVLNPPTVGQLRMSLNS